MSLEDKAICLIAFNGKQVNWTMWEEKFLAKVNIKGYKRILLWKETTPADEKEFDKSNPEGNEMKHLRNVNQLAYTDLILSIDGSSVNSCVA